MNGFDKKINSKRGEVTLGHILVIGMMILGVIVTVTIFSNLFGEANTGQWLPAEKTANDTYCKTQGSTGWAGGYANNLPICK